MQKEAVGGVLWEEECELIYIFFFFLSFLEAELIYTVVIISAVYRLALKMGKKQTLNTLTIH